MGFPKGFAKGFDFTSCVDITLVLRDFQVITGRFKGFSDDERVDFGNYGYGKGNHKEDKCKQEDQKDEKCCKQPKVDINVEVEEDCKFIIVELTRPVAAANLSSVTCSFIGEILTGLGLVLSGTTFPEGTCIAVNCENIIYAGPGARFCDIPINIGIADGGALSVTANK